MSRLVHAGSAVVDYVYRIDALPAPGTEKTATRHDRVVGGGFNLMVAASRTGMKVAFAGRHGTGPNADALRAALAGAGIDVLMPATAEADTGNSVVLVTDDAERTFVSWPGAESRLARRDLDAVTLRAGDVVFTSGYTLSYAGSREALAAWIEALPYGIPLVFDPTPVVADIPRPVLERVLARTDWLSCNADEAAFITGIRDRQDAAATLIERHCRRAAGVVVRCGRAGAFLRLRDGAPTMVPGFEVEAVDTNGAGDTHIGAFVSALSRGQAPLAAVRYANAAAALSVTRPGGSSAPTHAEILAFLAARANAAASLASA
jgi:sugar/nucleoside kinase (ribokinase family)